jgi:KUP system potassium uptake protein
MTSQAIMLGFIPRMEFGAQAPDKQIAHIYIPFVNWLLCLAQVVIFSVLGFQNDSNHLAYAYGIAVSITMLMTTLLFAQVVMKDLWESGHGVHLAFNGFVYSLGFWAFFSALREKNSRRGWFPVATASAKFLYWP